MSYGSPRTCGSNGTSVALLLLISISGGGAQGADGDDDLVLLQLRAERLNKSDRVSASSALEDAKPVVVKAVEDQDTTRAPQESGAVASRTKLAAGEAAVKAKKVIVAKANGVAGHKEGKRGKVLDKQLQSGSAQKKEGNRGKAHGNGSAQKKEAHDPSAKPVQVSADRQPQQQHQQHQHQQESVAATREEVGGLATATEHASVNTEATHAENQLREARVEAGQAVHMSEEEREAVTLPDVPDITANSEDVFNSLTANISELKSRLGRESTENAARAARHAAAFDDNITAQKKYIAALVAGKAAVADANAILTEENARLRMRAKELQRENTQKETRLQELQDNISYASEFVGKSLQDYDGLRDNNPPAELEVLVELAEKDATHNELVAKQRALEEVGEAGPASLLATGAHPGPSPHAAPDALLRSIGTRVEDFRDDDQDAETDLKEAFLAEFAKGQELLETLQGEKDALEVDQDALQGLKKRLQTAVNHLEDTGSHLSEQVNSTEAWMLKLGLRSLSLANDASGRARVHTK